MRIRLMNDFLACSRHENVALLEHEVSKRLKVFRARKA